MNKIREIKKKIPSFSRVTHVHYYTYFVFVSGESFEGCVLPVSAKCGFYLIMVLSTYVFLYNAYYEKYR